MEKYEKLNLIKEYITKIEEDVLLSDIDDKQSLMNKNITECLKYISEILEETISGNTQPSQNRNRFFITEEQTYDLTAKGTAIIGEIADEINKVTEINNTTKITTTWITDWLISVGILEINSFNQRMPTQKGEEMGVTSRKTTNGYGKEYFNNYYSYEMQLYIYDNIENIINFHYNSKAEKNKLKSKNQFFITEEQRLQLKTTEKAQISDIANKLNRFASENNTKKINVVWITDWLLETGILMKNDEGNRIPTPKGNETGIIAEPRTSQDGRTYFTNLYSKNAQQYIYDNIENIMNFHCNKRTNINYISYNFQNIKYPDNMPVNKFIAENKEKNVIIMSVGSCNTSLKEGSYKAIMIYQNSHKVIRGDMKTNSANRCILCGIKEATEAIKKPSDVMIISPTLLGFGTRKSANYDICEEIIDILTAKKCNIKILTCEGMGFEIRNYINLLSGNK